MRVGSDAWSPESCSQALGQAEEKPFPSTADLGLGGSANQAMGLPEAPGMTAHVTAKEHSGKEWAGPPGCHQIFPLSSRLLPFAS